MDRLRSLYARARALPPMRLDALLGVLWFVEASIEVLIIGPEPIACAIPVLIGAGVALRRRLPVSAVALAFGAMVVANEVSTAYQDNSAGPYFGILLVSFTAGTVLEGRRLWTAGAIGVGLSCLAVATDAYGDNPENFVMSSMLGVIGPMLLGQILRHRTRLNDALSAKAARIERERRDEADAAALEERTRIAGELHDVVAHALSAMTIQAAAARRLVERDPDQARAAFASAEHTGREALTELRRLLGVLRREDEDLALAPQPSLAHVAGLVRRATAAGLPTTLHTDGTARPLPAGVDLTAYRLVQEALSTARDGGGAGTAEVRIRYADGTVEVEITDDGAREGRRLLGMRERVAVYGGELTTAPPESGGWSVAARLPLEAAA
jgi:signal transduction histidine kinase